MSRLSGGKANDKTVETEYGLIFLVGIALCVFPTQMFAHEFGAGKSQYEDFLSGNQAVLADLPVLIGVIASGLFASIWKPDGLPRLWPFYMMGLLGGAFIGFWGTVPPIIPTYITAIIIGLLGAAAPNLETGVMRAIYILVGAALTNAVLSGHSLAEIPPFALLGIAFALNVGLAVCAGLVAVSLEKLPYAWVMIAWRAVMSWLVAMSVMAMAFTLSSAI